MKQSDLIQGYYKDSIVMHGNYYQTKLTPLGKELFQAAKQVEKTFLIDTRKTITPDYIINWQVIEAVGAGCTDLNDTYEVEIIERLSHKVLTKIKNSLLCRKFSNLLKKVF